MKIIIDKPFEKREWKGRCSSCGSEAIATESELNNITSDFREGGRFSWEVCPCCGKGNKGNGYGGMIFFDK